MTTLTLVLFILLLPLCLFLIGLILLQGGAGDISSAFGGGGQLDSTLGVGAGRKMSKITGWLSATFMTIVLLLSVQHAGDLGSAAGPAKATLPVGPDVPAPAAVAAPAPTAATLDPAPAVLAPAATAPVVEQPVAPTPGVSPAPVVPVVPVPAPVQPAEQPVPPTADPAAPTASPAPARSGITLDEPAK